MTPCPCGDTAHAVPIICGTILLLSMDKSNALRHCERYGPPDRKSIACAADSCLSTHPLPEVLGVAVEVEEAVLVLVVNESALQRNDKCVPQVQVLRYLCEEARDSAAITEIENFEHARSPIARCLQNLVTCTILRQSMHHSKLLVIVRYLSLGVHPTSSLQF